MVVLVLMEEVVSMYDIFFVIHCGGITASVVPLV